MFTLTRQLFGGVAALALLVAAALPALPAGMVRAQVDQDELSTADPEPLAQVSVSIVDSQYQPATVTVAVGGTVTWTNSDAKAHTVTSQTGAFDSGTLGQGGTFSQVFRQAGTFAYVCAFHDQQRGTITVTP